MRKKAWLAWAFAGFVALGWLGDDKSDKPTSTTGDHQTSVQTPRNIAPSHPSGNLSSSPISISVASAIQPPVSGNLFAISNVRLRSDPSTRAAVLLTIPIGSEVVAVATYGDWQQVTYAGQTGWAHGDYLSTKQPSLQQPSRNDVKRPIAPAPLIPQKQQQRSRSGEATREPYVGRCDCPYDLMRNGRRCGNNSAWSKPGGRNPVCYF